MRKNDFVDSGERESVESTLAELEEREPIDNEKSILQEISVAERSGKDVKNTYSIAASYYLDKSDYKLALHYSQKANDNYKAYRALWNLDQHKNADSVYFLYEKENISKFINNYLFLNEDKQLESKDKINGDLSRFLNHNFYESDPSYISNQKKLELIINTFGISSSSKFKLLEESKTSNDPIFISNYKTWQLYSQKYNAIQSDLLNTPLIKSNYNVSIGDSLDRIEQILYQSISEKNKGYSWIKYSQIKSRLKSNEALVQVYRYFKNQSGQLDTPGDTLVYLFYIVKPELSDPEIFITQKSMESEEEDFMQYLSYTSGKNKMAIDEKSYSTYWEFLADKLIGKSQVFVVADGIYNKLNLSNLFNVKSNTYLVDNVNFIYLNSVRSLINETKVMKIENKSAILVGDPSFKIDDLKDSESNLITQRDFQMPADTSTRGLNITPLPGTKDEVISIEGILKSKKWSTITYLNNYATESNLKKINSPFVLHIATHGFFLDDSKLKQAEKLDFASLGLNRYQPKPINPLFRSGLLLAGSKNYLNDKKHIDGEDGILSAYETGFLNLSSTELVVLSACETGRGKILNGEGVYGLRKSVFDAGAKNLIISLWKVDDKVTKEFMETFYTQWISNNNLANAFNATQKIIKIKYPQPYYWSAFVLVK